MDWPKIIDFYTGEGPNNDLIAVKLDDGSIHVTKVGVKLTVSLHSDGSMHIVGVDDFKCKIRYAD